MTSYLGKYSGTWDQFVKLFLAGHLVYGDWLSHVEGYWRLQRQNPRKVLIISYEELKTRLPKTIARVGHFVGKTFTADVIEKMANHCSFAEMSANQMVNREVSVDTQVFDMSETKFMRKGIIGKGGHLI